MTAQPRRPHNQPRRSKASLIMLIMLAFLLLAAAVALAASMPEETVLPDSTQPVETAQVDTVGFDCDPVEAQKLIPFGQGVAKLTPTRLSFLAMDGSELFAAEIDMASPYALSNAQRLVAADREGTSFVVIDGDGVVLKGNREGRIVGIAQDSDRALALIEDRHDSTGVVSVLDPANGQLLFECFFPESGYVLKTRFAPASDAFDVVLANTDRTSVQMVLKRFARDGTAQGQRLLSEAGLYPELTYDRSGQPVLVGDTRLIGLAYDREANRYAVDLPRIEAVAETSAGLVVLAAERLGGKLALYTVGENGERSPGTEIGDTATPLSVLDQQVALGSGTHVYVYNATTGQLILDSNLAAEIVRVGFADQGTLTVITASGVRRLNIDSDSQES